MYQQKAGEAIDDAKGGICFEDCRHTFVVDMELPVFNNTQPGVTYFYSPLTVNNIGMVNHAHEYENREVKAHM